MSSLHGIPVKAAPVRHRSQLALAFTSSGATPSTSAPSLQPHVVPPKWEHSPLVHQLPTKGVQAPPRAGTHPAIGANPRAGRGPFPKPRPVVLPMVSFGQAKLAGLGHIHNADSDLIHHQFRLSILQ